jgi:hypothetical protein
MLDGIHFDLGRYARHDSLLQDTRAACAAWGHQCSHGYGLFEAKMPSEKIRWIRSLRGAECEWECILNVLYCEEYKSQPLISHPHMGYIDTMPDAEQRVTTARLSFIGSLILIASIALVLLVISSAAQYKEERGDTNSLSELHPKDLELTQRQNLDTDKGTSKLPSTQTFDVAFFRDTDTGRAILAYLICEDFDCTEAFTAISAIRQDAVRPLIQILRYGVSPEVATQIPGTGPVVVQRRVISALGDLGDTQALNPLIETVRDPDPLVRAEAANALGKINGEDALIALLPLLQDPDPLVREMTAISLGKLKRQEALPSLRSAARAEPKPHVQHAMETAIQTIEQ